MLAHVVVDRERDVVPRPGLLDAAVLDLHRGDRLDEVRRVAVHVDPIAHLERGGQRDRGDREVAEVVGHPADRIGRIVLV